MLITSEDRAHAQDLLNFIDASPSPWHAVDTITQRLQAQGFVPLQEKLSWKLESGKGYYVVRGASLITFMIGQQPLTDTGFRMIGAHTDSPGLRLKTNAAHASDGVVRLGVEIYGGPILATFTDRDLSLAGRVNVRTAQGFESYLINFRQPLLRLPNLAIHMNKDVNEQGLKLNKQTELPLLFGIADDTLSAREQFLNLLADELKVKAADILTYELNVCDTQAGAFWGVEQEFIANSQLDNLASCHAALTALLATSAPAATCIAAFFDHEEVGSESTAGAGGSFAGDVIERISLCMGLDDEQQHCAAAHSFFISADMAHAYQPNFPNAYEPNHHVMVNAGPVIKTNSNQRYSTDADTAARFITLCESAGVPYQNYTHRTDLGCGSTIGPVVAASLGIASLDVGSPMWAMHSLRESAGVQDVAYMIKVMKATFGS
ncbi:M18 family aminopeptidase [Candidatus Nitrotoga sp. M5]|uniref:M18 family aminopeptidase n=1 Tax=Candidatus Nitrotoga sp. M5 TaxID=2890409 RepID=UPI001EF2837C|nr:M18 family aminopeptidase [Candidatus Nitrotoga sp. M5]CAH1385248.1 putative M18 family aminopeptidase 2 [Candidatus Nitrotoga sp. M5]